MYHKRTFLFKINITITDSYQIGSEKCIKIHNVETEIIKQAY